MVSAIRKAVAWTVAVALLSYTLAGAPIMLQMAASAASPTQHATGSPCLHHERHSGDTSACDHEHCLFCQGGAGIGILAAPISDRLLAFETAHFAPLQTLPPAFRRSDSGYVSRAPPPLT